MFLNSLGHGCLKTYAAKETYDIVELRRSMLWAQKSQSNRSCAIKVVEFSSRRRTTDQTVTIYFQHNKNYYKINQQHSMNGVDTVLFGTHTTGCLTCHLLLSLWPPFKMTNIQSFIDMVTLYIELSSRMKTNADPSLILAQSEGSFRSSLPPHDHQTHPPAAY